MRLQCDVEVADAGLYDAIVAAKTRGYVGVHDCTNAKNIPCVIKNESGEPYDEDA